MQLLSKPNRGWRGYEGKPRVESEREHEHERELSDASHRKVTRVSGPGTPLISGMFTQTAWG